MRVLRLILAASLATWVFCARHSGAEDAATGTPAREGALYFESLDSARLAVYLTTGKHVGRDKNDVQSDHDSPGGSTSSKSGRAGSFWQRRLLQGPLEDVVAINVTGLSGRIAGDMLEERGAPLSSWQLQPGLKAAQVRTAAGSG